MASGSLRQQFAGGVSWLYALKFLQRLVGTVQIAIVARFVAPEEFGIIGIALLILGVVEMLAATGLDQALIQQPTKVRDELDTLWLVAVGRGLVLGAVLYLSAPLVASFFEEPQAAPVLRYIAAVPVLRGLQSAGLVDLNKELRFKRLVALEASKTLISAVTGITLAVILQSVWALVAVHLVSLSAETIGSYIIHPYRPKGRFRLDHVRRLWRFGKWITVSTWMHYITNQGDYWVVGKLLGAAPLGLYRTAYRLGSAPMSEVTTVLSKVAFPAFSKMQHDPERLRRAYLRLLQLVTFVSTPLSVGLILVAEQAIGVLLGERWLAMVPAFQVLLVCGMVRAFRGTAGPILMAVDRPDIGAKLTLFKVVVMAALIVPFSLEWDIAGTAWAVTVAAVLEVPLLLRAVAREIEVESRRVYGRIVAPLLYALPMVAVVLVLQHFVVDAVPAWLGLALVVAAGAVVHTGAAIALDSRFGYGVWDDLRQIGGEQLRPLVRGAKEQLRRAGGYAVHE